MSEHEPGGTDALAPSRMAPIYRSASLTLIWGFRVTAVLLTVGVSLQAVQGDEFSSSARPIPTIVELLLDGETRALVDLAIVAMILTPVAAVLAIATGFARIGDRRSATASLVVLGILVISIAVSLAT